MQVVIYAYCFYKDKILVEVGMGTWDKMKLSAQLHAKIWDKKVYWFVGSSEFYRQVT